MYKKVSFKSTVSLFRTRDTLALIRTYILNNRYTNKMLLFKFASLLAQKLVLYDKAFDTIVIHQKFHKTFNSKHVQLHLYERRKQRNTLDTEYITVEQTQGLSFAYSYCKLHVAGCIHSAAVVSSSSGAIENI